MTSTTSRHLLNARTVFAGLTILLLLPSSTALSTDSRSQCAAAQVVPPPEIVNPYLADELHEQTMRELFTEDSLAAMDALALEPELIPSLDPQLAGNGNLEPVVEQVGDPKTVTNVFLKDAISIPSAEPPTISSRLKLVETSKEKDRWFFQVMIQALCDEYVVGYGSKSIIFKDNWGKDDTGSQLLEVEFKELGVSILDVEFIKVNVFTEWCKSGWYSGKNKGCTEDQSSDAFDGHVTKNMELHFQ